MVSYDCVNYSVGDGITSAQINHWRLSCDGVVGLVNECSRQAQCPSADSGMQGVPPDSNFLSSLVTTTISQKHIIK